ncbi:hypothetical protein NEUTE1DRAFT_52022 [Neurospora tetrasperma FGSC 2508]|uniref:Uncharacterized protein n=1 Tax=Neurospora tetrasperma (strain FGSC 2508 / ATCC MYA-4615 / P0657) TaxID=510951 RepID=F8N4Q1_NEUT8|nr:uncharacterized protein NEUTE1DRAFT_52022 [Neurospora tetrasperma FGSC 2508]EGO51888.1 hypothetical protein NEUTE1DRAFT_52022 [Neurospora tetrasperma FGSC 2508]
MANSQAKVAAFPVQRMRRMAPWQVVSYPIQYLSRYGHVISLIHLYHEPSIWPSNNLRRFPGKAATQIVNRQPYVWSRPVVSV